jgi:hypothetical protein
MTKLELPDQKSLEANWVDKVISIAEKISFIVMLFPFGSMALWILTPIFLEGDYFIFFPTAMFSFFPAGIFALLVQIFRIGRKRPANNFSIFLFVASLITTLIGSLACMAIYVVTS